MNETSKHQKTDDFLIDPNNNEELTYIASKFGCSVDDIFLAIETTKSTQRSEIYSWLVDYIFKNHRR